MSGTLKNPADKRRLTIGSYPESTSSDLARANFAAFFPLSSLDFFPPLYFFLTFVNLPYSISSYE